MVTECDAQATQNEHTRILTKTRADRIILWRPRRSHYAKVNKCQWQCDGTDVDGNITGSIEVQKRKKHVWRCRDSRTVKSKETR